MTDSIERIRRKLLGWIPTLGKLLFQGGFLDLPWLGLLLLSIRFRLCVFIPVRVLPGVLSAFLMGFFPSLCSKCLALSVGSLVDILWFSLLALHWFPSILVAGR